MRHVFLVGLFCFIATPTVLAQDAAPPDTAADRVQIVEDDATGAIRFVIDGKEVGRIDAEGLYVAGDVAYTGIITDIGAPEAEAENAP